MKEFPEDIFTAKELYKKGSHEYRPGLLTQSQPSWPVSSEIMASL